MTEYRKKPAVMKAIARFTVSDEYRFWATPKMKLILRRAAWRAGLPIKDIFALATDRVQIQNWSAGTNYILTQFYEKVLDTADVIEKLNENLPDEIRVVSFMTLPMSYPSLQKANDSALYEMKIPYNQSEAQHLVDQVLAKDSLVAKLKSRGKGRGTVENTATEIRPMIKMARAEAIDGAIGECRLYLHLDLAIGPYDVLPSLLQTSRRRALSMPAHVVDFFVEGDEHQDDFFIDTCEICGKKIQSTIEDQRLSPRRCLLHMEGVV